MGGPEARIAAIKALGSVGDPSAYPAVLPYARHEDWVFRAQAAKALGILGGAASIPELLDLLRDPTFEVRRNAAEALARMGPAGREALAWVAQDRSADPFARDLALERLQWTPGGSAA
jgi:HEAT repeat protein